MLENSIIIFMLGACFIMMCLLADQKGSFHTTGIVFSVGCGLLTYGILGQFFTELVPLVFSKVSFSTLVGGAFGGVFWYFVINTRDVKEEVV